VPETSEARERLPTRRRAVTHDVAIGAIEYHASIGFDLNGAPKEVFLSSGKPGSHVDSLLNDAGIAISIALQCGIKAAAMAVSTGRSGDPAQPVSAIGSALLLLADYERELEEAE
jgi:hypothetical protein